jgi:pimeloyl-ACP methyl ester carboxylesterase
MFTTIRGRLVHTITSGRDGRTIVGVAGAFGTAEIWEQPFELLSRRHTTIAYDHFGTGETHVPPELVTFDEHVAVLEELLDAFSIDRCVLCGDSSMVTVAVEVAARHPQRVDALALVAGGVVQRGDDLTRGFVARLRSDFDKTIDRFVAMCVPEGDAQHVRPWLRDIIARTGGERAATLIEALYDVDLTPRLAELKMPVVVIQGEHDALPASNLESARAMAARVPNARLELLPDTGHVPTLTRPREVAAIIEKLIERIGP